MIKKIMCISFALLFFISCAHINTTQNNIVEHIDGFTFEEKETLELNNSKISGNTKVLDVFSRKHQGSILSIVPAHDKTSFFSSSSDGFIGKHTFNNSIEFWQISNLSIPKIAIHPNNSYIAVYETDKFNIHRLSVWDWETKQRIFVKRFTDSILTISWSARGTWLFVGNTSVNGFTVFETKNWQSNTIFSQSLGIISLAATGDSETTMVAYGNSGNITYKDTKNGETKAEFETVSGLMHPLLYANNSKIVGYKEGLIYVQEAASGKTIETYESSQPLFINTDKAHVSWIQTHEDNVYILQEHNWVSDSFSLKNGDTISAVSFCNDIYIIGSTKGNIYFVSLENYDFLDNVLEPQEMQSIQKIDDIASINNQIYFISSGLILGISNINEKPTFYFDSGNHNKICAYSNGLLLYSSINVEPLVYANFDGTVSYTLYNPEEPINSIHINTNLVSFVEGNTKVKIIDFSGKEIFVYTGAGFQDVLLVDESFVIISKSSTVKSPYPLVLANIYTGETVPIPVTGDLCYGLNKVQGESNSYLGITINSEIKNTNTSLMKFFIQPKRSNETRFETLAKISDEDLSAQVISIDTSSILTTLGKTALVEINTEKNMQYIYKRTVSLPKKITVTNDYCVILNFDGSITLSDLKNKKNISTSFINNKNQWITINE